MSGQIENECGNCKFFHPLTNNTYEGRCHRYPPVFIPNIAEVEVDIDRIGKEYPDHPESQEAEDLKMAVDKTTASIIPWSFPVVAVDDFCGEHQDA